MNPSLLLPNKHITVLQSGLNKNEQYSKCFCLIIGGDRILSTLRFPMPFFSIFTKTCSRPVSDRIYLQCALTLKESQKDESLHINPFHQYLLYSFTSYSFPKLIQLLNQHRNGMDCSLLYSIAKLTVIQPGLLLSSFVRNLFDFKEGSQG